MAGEARAELIRFTDVGVVGSDQCDGGFVLWRVQRPGDGFELGDGRERVGQCGRVQIVCVGVQRSDGLGDVEAALVEQVVAVLVVDGVGSGLESAGHGV
ncbi:hypothetical protein IUS99_03415 [Mycobacteroides abscessus subsp. massiliense]|uniref:hypothetical protein n=1 Tax=Mycobacteroides abscessus TaxID=36809 RepID=UPI0019D189DE|nr:hypothetical protein [Mycobacteroides abscessus]MBN7315808.1 hypothetical protein [Mycobacteroides abscessus subsp. massiliense]